MIIIQINRRYVLYILNKCWNKKETESEKMGHPVLSSELIYRLVFTSVQLVHSLWDPNELIRKDEEEEEEDFCVAGICYHV